MDYEKPFIFIDTNFKADEAMMLMMAFDSYDFELMGVSTHSSLMTPRAAAENIVAISVAEDLYLSVAAGDELLKDYEDKSIFTTKLDYVEEMSAADAIIDKADDTGRLDIIATGPLTNLAAALDEAPEIEDYISHIFIGGGSLAGEAEESFLADPTAIDRILNTSIDLFILPEEVYKSVVMTDELIDELRGKRLDLDLVLDEFKNISEDERYLKAPLLLYLTQTPEAFIFEEAGFRVDTEEEKGSLRRDDGRKKNYMANKVNEEAFYDFIRGSFQ